MVNNRVASKFYTFYDPFLILQMLLKTLQKAEDKDKEGIRVQILVS